jgi:type IV secretion system protein VirB4
VLFNPFPKQRQLSAYLPLALPVTENADIIMLDDGSVFALCELQTAPWETRSALELLYQYSALNTAYCNLAHQTVIFHIYICREQADLSVYPRGKFTSPVAEDIDAAYRNSLLSTKLWWNTLYLGVQICPPSQIGEIIVEKKPKNSGNEVQEERFDRLEGLLHLLQYQLAAYKPRKLGLRDGIFCEIAETLAFAMTGVRRPVGLTTGRVGQAMISEDIIIGRETIEYRDAGGSRYGAAFGMRHYLKPGTFGVFNQMLNVPNPGTLYHCFRCMPTYTMHGIMQRKQMTAVKVVDPSREDPAEFAQATHALMNGDLVMGDHSMVYLTFAEDPKQLREVASATKARLSATGATITREAAALEAALFSLCPGNLHLRPRCGYVSSPALIAMAPFHGSPRGKPRGRWGDPAAIFRLMSGEPYMFHYHSDQVANIVIYGRTGSGKTLMLAFLLVQADRFGAQTVIWDKNRGLKILIVSLGGTYLELKRPTGIAPLRRLHNTEEDVQFLFTLFKGCILSDGLGPINADDERRLHLGIRMTMELPPEQRDLAEVRAFMGIHENGAGERLEKWCWGESNQGIIDNPADLVELDASIIGFDQTHILDDEVARGPVIATLYHYTDKLIDGVRRSIRAADEFWKSMQEKAFRDLFDDQVKARGRKGNCVNIYITQSPRDGLNSPLAHTLREQMSWQFYFAPGESPVAADYCEGGMGLTEREFEIVCGLPMGTGDFLLHGEGTSLRAQLPFGGLDQQIAIMSGNDRTVDQFDRALAKHGQDIAAVVRTFHEIQETQQAQEKVAA